MSINYKNTRTETHSRANRVDNRSGSLCSQKICRTGEACYEAWKARHERWLPSHRSWQIGLPLKRRSYLMAYRDIASSASGNCAKFHSNETEFWRFTRASSSVGGNSIIDHRYMAHATGRLSWLTKVNVA